MDVANKVASIVTSGRGVRDRHPSGTFRAEAADTRRPLRAWNRHASFHVLAPQWNPRGAAIDTLRGVAVILMVAGHVIGGTAQEGLQVATESAWRHSYDLFADIRMPLFTALSGFVYGLRPLRSPRHFGHFVWRKQRRLLIPLLTVGTAFALVQALMPGTNTDTAVSDVWRVWVFGTAHFWFLQSIFIILVVLSFADAVGWLATARRVLHWAGTAAVLSVVVHIPQQWDIFSVGGAFRLAPFFLLGYLFSAHALEVRRLGGWLLGTTAALFVVRCAEVFNFVHLAPLVDSSLGVLLGMAAVSALIAFRESLAWRPLALLGYFSFAIYLFHVFGTASTRIAMTRVGVESDAVVFATALSAGIALPILIAVVLGRSAWASWTFLGQRDAPAHRSSQSGAPLSGRVS